MVDAVTLEVARNRFAGVAEEMGLVLRRTAYSPNIKERADCSAAIFVPNAEMLAQAEHIPVHLGSMPASVAAIQRRLLVLEQEGAKQFLGEPALDIFDFMRTGAGGYGSRAIVAIIYPPEREPVIAALFMRDTTANFARRNAAAARVAAAIVKSVDFD